MGKHEGGRDNRNNKLGNTGRRKYKTRIKTNNQKYKKQNKTRLPQNSKPQQYDEYNWSSYSCDSLLCYFLFNVAAGPHIL